MDTELIETLWNVNVQNINVSRHFVGINRNIVECKWLQSRIALVSDTELIETLWNVNEYVARLLYTLLGN